MTGFLFSRYMSSPQTFSHYPAWPAPVRIPLVTIEDHSCSYLPGRSSRTRAVMVQKMPPELYHRFMDAGFRRSGCLIYQPVCNGCRACVPIRVPVDRFKPGKSQRRCLRKNADLVVSIDPPQASDEKFELYQRYLRDWHNRDAAAIGEESREQFESFLYASPLDSTIEFTYRDRNGRLLAVGICDVCQNLSLSSVYCYFDPAFSTRGLGTYAALRELEYARIQHLQYFYLGYWINDCAAMNYKSFFSPNEVLHTDGIWRESRPKMTSGVGGNNISSD